MSKDEETKALTIVEPEMQIARIGPNKLAYEPTDADQAFRMATWLVKSGFYPSFKKPEQAFVVMAKGKELGMSTLQAVDGMHVIKGKIAMAAQTMVALVKKSGEAQYIKCTHNDGKSATWETLRKDDSSGRPVVVTFTIEQAKRRGYLNKDNWKTMPENMLMWRAAAMICRQEYPEIIMGLYDPEELRDHAPAPRRQAARYDEATGEIVPGSAEDYEQSNRDPTTEHLTNNEANARIKVMRVELGEQFCKDLVGSEGVDPDDSNEVLALLEKAASNRKAWIDQFWKLIDRLGWTDEEATQELKDKYEQTDPVHLTQEQVEEVVLHLRNELKKKDD